METCAIKSVQSNLYQKKLEAYIPKNFTPVETSQLFRQYNNIEIK